VIFFLDAETILKPTLRIRWIYLIQICFSLFLLLLVFSLTDENVQRFLYIVNLSFFFMMAVIFFILESEWEDLGPGLDLGPGGRGAGGPEARAMTGAGRSHR